MFSHHPLNGRMLLLLHTMQGTFSNARTHHSALLPQLPRTGNASLPFAQLHRSVHSRSLFIVTVRYQRPLAEVDRILEAHKCFLEEGYQRGIFLASGRLKPRTGGVIFASVSHRTQLEALLAQDPFQQQGIATYDISEVEITRHAQCFQAVADRDRSTEPPLDQRKPNPGHPVISSPNHALSVARFSYKQGISGASESGIQPTDPPIHSTSSRSVECSKIR